MSPYRTPGLVVLEVAKDPFPMLPPAPIDPFPPLRFVGLSPQVRADFAMGLAAGARHAPLIVAPPAPSRWEAFLDFVARIFVTD